MQADTMHLHRDAAGHLVQFYAAEDELTTSVGAYLLNAIRCGGTAIAIATPSHCASFATYLAAAGVDVSAAQADGSFVVLDAEETMRRFVVAERPDPDAFEAVIGSLIREASGSGRPVHAFGEMVALMWDAGHVNAAIELEQMWNELGERLPFALYCAYSTQSTSHEADRGALIEICRLHSAVVRAAPEATVLARAAHFEQAAQFPTREAERTFAGVPACARIARHFAIETLLHWGEGSVAEDAALVVAELAGNAVQHTAAEFTLTLRSSPSGVRISVRDSSVFPAVRREAKPTATSGRGLALIAAVSDQWRCEPDERGKVVWAELARHPS